MNIRSKKGITILALIITVVLLLLLAGVGLGTIKSGLASKAIDAKMWHEIGEIKDDLDMYKMQCSIDKKKGVTVDEYTEYLLSDTEYGKGERVKPGNVKRLTSRLSYVTVDGKYMYKVEEKDGQNIEIIYMGIAGGVELSEYSGIFDATGENRTREVQITANVSGGELEVVSSDTSVATVELTKSGKLGSITVTALKPDSETIITVTSKAIGKYADYSVQYRVSTRKVFDVIAEEYNGVYDGQPHGITVTCTPSDATITYSTDGINFNLTEAPKYTEASEHTTYFKVEKEGYTTLSDSSTVTITKATGGLTLSSSSGEYTVPTTGTFTVLNNTGTISVSSADSNIATATVSGNTVIVTPIGIWDGEETRKSVTINVVSQTSANYEQASTTYTAIVNKGTITVNATAWSGTYDGTSKTITVSYTPSDATITYSADGLNYSSTKPTFTNASSTPQTVYYRIEKAGYITESGSETVTINKANNTLTLSTNNGGTITTPNTGTFTITNNTSQGAITVTSSNTEVATVSLSGNTVTVTPNKENGNITVTVTSAETANYYSAVATYTANVIAHVHTYGWVTTTAATCTTTGTKVYKCSSCGDISKTETIAALGHDYARTGELTTGTLTDIWVTQYEGQNGVCVICVNDTKYTNGVWNGKSPLMNLYTLRTPEVTVESGTLPSSWIRNIYYDQYCKHVAIEGDDINRVTCSSGKIFAGGTNYMFSRYKSSNYGTWWYEGSSYTLSSIKGYTYTSKVVYTQEQCSRCNAVKANSAELVRVVKP